MNIGFIGAGKVGCTLGLHLISNSKQSDVTGYYDLNEESLQETLNLTKAKRYNNYEEVINENDIIFITVTDTAIKDVWEVIKSKASRKELSLEEKIICHCSGSLSSAIFSEIDAYKAYGYSIHPLFACSNKTDSYKTIPKALFTIEGSREKLDFMKELFINMGNKVQVIKSDVKTKYHAAAVVASNLMLALASLSNNMLVDCGFSKENASSALNPLIENNINSLVKKGVINSLTGPVERNDVCTINNHLKVLNEDEKLIYKALSKELVKVSKEKNANNDYSELIKVLK